MNTRADELVQSRIDQEVRNFAAALNTANTAAQVELTQVRIRTLMWAQDATLEEIAADLQTQNSRTQGVIASGTAHSVNLHMATIDALNEIHYIKTHA